MTISRRHFMLATASMGAAIPSFADNAGLERLLEGIGENFDNIVFTEPHIGGMAFSAPMFLGQPEGPIAILGEKGKRHLGLELPDISPGINTAINLQTAIDRIAGNRQLLGKVLFGQAHIRPTFLAAADPALANVPIENRMENFYNGILDTMTVAHQAKMQVQLMNYYNPALVDFVHKHAQALGHSDTTISLPAARSYAELRLDDRYQIECLRSRIKAPLKNIVAIVGWQHTAGLIPVPGIDTLLDGSTAVVSLFHDRANEEETLRMSAPLGRPTREGFCKIYLAKGEVVKPDGRIIARFHPFDILKSDRGQSLEQSAQLAPR